MDQGENNRYIVERLERVEREVESHRGIISGLVTKTAVFDEVVNNINRSLSDIQVKISSTNSTISRVGWILISGVLVAAVTFVVKGGLNVVPN